MGSNRRHGYENWGLVDYFSRNRGNNYFKNSTKNPNPNIHGEKNFCI